MGKRGPGKKPTVLKLQDGVQQNHPNRINHAEPVCAPVDRTIPAWMCDEERAKWLEMIELLDPTGIMTQNDRDCVSLYCVTWCKWLNAHLTGNVSVERETATRLRHMMGALGMTPSSRAGLKADGPGLTQRDAFAEMFRKQYGPA